MKQRLACSGHIAAVFLHALVLSGIGCVWSQLAGLQGCLLGKAWHVVWSHCWVLVMLALTGFSYDLTALSDVSAAGQPTKSLMDTNTPCMILLTVGVPALLMPSECMYRCVCGRCDSMHLSHCAAQLCASMWFAVVCIRSRPERGMLHVHVNVGSAHVAACSDL